MTRRALILTLLLPAMLFLARGDAADPPGAPDDHFLCDKIRPSAGTPRFGGAPGLHLIDAFEDRTFDARKTQFFCTPADKNAVANGSARANVRLWRICQPARSKTPLKFPINPNLRWSLIA